MLQVKLFLLCATWWIQFYAMRILVGSFLLCTAHFQSTGMLFAVAECGMQGDLICL